MQAGLVSVTFRPLSPLEIIQLAAEARLASIEWGGDVHVPHGDVKTAREVGLATGEAGLRVCSYGAYYRLGHSEGDGLSFESVRDTALELGAPTIRVWAGTSASTVADEEYRRNVEKDAVRVCDLARESGLKVALEFHSGTLTDTAPSARALLDAVDHPDLHLIWQPPVGRTVEECLDGLMLLADRVCHVHAFHWWPDSKHRLPLAEGEDRWKRYLSHLHESGKDSDVLLEFVPEGDPQILKREAEVLSKLLIESASLPG